jgi:hypothetical protein
MPSYNFSPIGSSLTTQAVDGTAGGGGIGSGNIPGGARYAEGFVRTASIVETRDGTAPTSTKGTEWDAGDIILLRSRDEITKFLAIEKDSGSSETIDWQFYNRAPN